MPKEVVHALALKRLIGNDGTEWHWVDKRLRGVELADVMMRLLGRMEN